MGVRTTFFGGLVGLFTATAAQAAVVSIGLGGYFSDAEIVAPERLEVTSQGNHMEWGRGGASTLTFHAGNFRGDVTESVSVELGQFVWLNQSSFRSGGLWETALALSLDIDGPSDRTMTGTYGVRIDNTKDVSNDLAANERSGLNPDTLDFVVLDGVFGAPVSLGNGVFLENLRFELTTPATVERRGIRFRERFTSTFDSGTNRWVNAEGNTSVVSVYGDLTVAAVPLPASVFLLIGALAGLGAVRIRRGY